MEKSKRIKTASATRIRRHKAELLDINILLNYIRDSGEVEPKNMSWIKTKIFQRIDELEIANKSNSYAPWTAFEIKWIKDNYKKVSARELAIDLERATSSVQRMINKLKIKKTP